MQSVSGPPYEVTSLLAGICRGPDAALLFPVIDEDGGDADDDVALTMTGVVDGDGELFIMCVVVAVPNGTAAGGGSGCDGGCSSYKEAGPPQPFIMVHQFPPAAGQPVVTAVTSCSP